MRMHHFEVVVKRLESQPIWVLCSLFTLVPTIVWVVVRQWLTNSDAAVKYTVPILTQLREDFSIQFSKDNEVKHDEVSSRWQQFIMINVFYRSTMGEFTLDVQQTDAV